MKTGAILVLVFVACAFARPAESPVHQNKENVADSLKSDKEPALQVNHRVKRHFGLQGLLGALFDNNDEIGYNNDEFEYLPNEGFNGFEHPTESEGFDDADFNGFGELYSIFPYI